MCSWRVIQWPKSVRKALWHSEVRWQVKMKWKLLGSYKEFYQEKSMQYFPLYLAMMLFISENFFKFLQFAFEKKYFVTHTEPIYSWNITSFFSYFGYMQFADESFHLSLLKKAQNSIFVYLNYIWTRGYSYITIKHKHLISLILHPHIIIRPTQFQIYTTKLIS